jgi:hypothetical protein
MLGKKFRPVIFPPGDAMTEPRRADDILVTIIVQVDDMNAPGHGIPGPDRVFGPIDIGM